MSDEPTPDGQAPTAAPATDDGATDEAAPIEPTTTDEPATDEPATLEPVAAQRRRRRHARSPGTSRSSPSCSWRSSSCSAASCGWQCRRAIAGPRRPHRYRPRVRWLTQRPSPRRPSSGSVPSGGGSLAPASADPSPTRCSSGPATSPTAVSTPMQPPRACSTASTAPSSRPATTPTPTARPSSSALLRQHLGSPAGPHPAGARQPRLGHQGPRRLPRVLRRGRGPGRQELVLVRPRDVARHRARLRLHVGRRLRAGDRSGPLAGRRPRGVDGSLHARDLAPPAVQLRRSRQRSVGGAVLDGALRRRRRRRRQRPRPRLRAVRCRRTPTVAPDAARGLREFVVGTGGAALRAFPNAGRQQRAARQHRPRRHPVRAPPDVLRLDVPADHRWLGRLGERGLPLTYRVRR